MDGIGARIAAALALVLTPMIGSADEATLSGQEIASSWAGRDLIGTTPRGARSYMRLETDGRASLSVGDFSDAGHWRPSENGYCTRWTKIRAGEERCFTVARSGWNYKLLNPDGSTAGVIHGVK